MSTLIVNSITHSGNTGTDNLALDNSGNVKLSASIQDSSGNNSSTAEQIQQGRAKAYVNCGGGSGVSSGTSLTINNSFNVSSVVDKGTGRHKINFSNAMPNSECCPVFGFSRQDSNIIVFYDYNDDTKSANHIHIRTTYSWSSGGTLADLTELYVAIFGD